MLRILVALIIGMSSATAQQSGTLSVLLDERSTFLLKNPTAIMDFTDAERLELRSLSFTDSDECPRSEQLTTIFARQFARVVAEHDQLARPLSPLSHAAARWHLARAAMDIARFDNKCPDSRNAETREATMGFVRRFYLDSDAAYTGVSVLEKVRNQVHRLTEDQVAGLIRGIRLLFDDAGDAESSGLVATSDVALAMNLVYGSAKKPQQVGGWGKAIWVQKPENYEANGVGILDKLDNSFFDALPSDLKTPDWNPNNACDTGENAQLCAEVADDFQISEIGEALQSVGLLSIDRNEEWLNVVTYTDAARGYKAQKSLSAEKLIHKQFEGFPRPDGFDNEIWEVTCPSVATQYLGKCP